MLDEVIGDGFNFLIKSYTFYHFHCVMIVHVLTVCLGSDLNKSKIRKKTDSLHTITIFLFNYWFNYSVSQEQ